MDPQNDTEQEVKDISQDGFEDIENAPETDETSSGQASVIINLESLINEKLESIDEMNREANQLKESVDSVLENDETYKTHTEQAKEANRIKSATKNEILKRPEVAHVALKLKELKDDIKTAREDLSSFLQEYAQTSGQTQFETKDGTVRQIVYVAKLVKPQS